MLNAEEQKLIDTSIDLRETEKQVIADKKNPAKVQAHMRAKMVWRDAADRMIRMVKS